METTKIEAFKKNIADYDFQLTNWESVDRNDFSTKEIFILNLKRGSMVFNVLADGYVSRGKFDYDQPSEDEMKITSITVELSEYTFEGLEDNFLTDEEVGDLCRYAEKTIINKY